MNIFKGIRFSEIKSKKELDSKEEQFSNSLSVLIITIFVICISIALFMGFWHNILSFIMFNVVLLASIYALSTFVKFERKRKEFEDE